MAVCAALFLALYLPSHLLSVRDQIRRPSASQTRADRIVARPRQPAQEMTGAAPRDFSKPSSPVASIPDTEVSTEQRSEKLSSTPIPPVSEAVKEKPPPARAGTPEHKPVSKPKTHRKIVARPAKVQRKIALRKREPRIAANWQESEPRSLDGLEFWWKDRSRNERQREALHAGFRRPRNSGGGDGLASAGARWLE
jgi:hypothetical protein